MNGVEKDSIAQEERSAEEQELTWVKNQVETNQRGKEVVTRYLVTVKGSGPKNRTKKSSIPIFRVSNKL